MLENVNLILRDEDEILYKKQENLINEFEVQKSSEILTQIALLQMVFPICDPVSAIGIMKEYMFDDVEFLIIGAHLCAEQLEIEENIFLNRLVYMEQLLNDEQKSIVKYLMALHEYNRVSCATESLVLNLEESISLCDKLVSNYRLRYLLFHNKEDIRKARSNVLKVRSIAKCETLTLDEMIKGKFYIEEYVTMQSLSEIVFEGLCFDMEKIDL